MSMFIIVIFDFVLHQKTFLLLTQLTRAHQVCSRESELSKKDKAGRRHSWETRVTCCVVQMVAKHQLMYQEFQMLL